MALFAALIAFTENEELRLQTRPVHREYLRSLLDAGKLSMSGPWADDTGALIIYGRRIWPRQSAFSTATRTAAPE
jgi:uncharacterized protein YciI